ncbi:MAG: hypothetical protein EA369_04210 [Bradymonadales bacterium]|nr:MAG: hypothetical protein EA369_04210 [Bradymonadales bacterium]
MLSFFPSRRDASALYTDLQAALRLSLSHIFDEVVSPDTVATEIRKTIGGDRPLGALAFALNECLIQAVDRSKASIDIIVAAAANTDRLVKKPDLIVAPYTQENEHPFINHLIYSDCKSPYAQLTEDEAKVVKELVRSSLEKVQLIVPEYKQEFDVFIERIVLHRDDSVISSSSFFSFGNIYLNSCLIEANWVSFFDKLIHEAAHHYLFALCAFDKIIKNDPGRLFESPLREDARPIDGVFHQAFVVCRLMHAMKKVATSPRVELEFRDDAHQLFLEYRESLSEAVSTLEEHAKFTKRGKMIFNSIQRALNEYSEDRSSG